MHATLYKATDGRIWVDEDCESVTIELADDTVLAIIEESAIDFYLDRLEKATS